MRPLAHWIRMRAPSPACDETASNLVISAPQPIRYRDLAHVDKFPSRITEASRYIVRYMIGSSASSRALASLERDNSHSQRRPCGSPSRGRSINILSGRPLTWFDQIVWCDANHVFPSVRVFNSYFLPLETAEQVPLMRCCAMRSMKLPGSYFG